jgi:hypothetical protein
MSKDSGLGFGGLLLGLGIGFVVFRYFKVTSNLFAILMILLGIVIIGSSLIKSQLPRFEYGDLFGGLIGGLILSLIFTSGFGFISDFGPSISGSGKLVTETYDYTGFNIVEAEEGFEVVISKSNSYGVSVTTDDNVMEKVRISKQGDTIHFELAPGDFKSLKLKAVISMPELNELVMSSGAHGEVSGFTSSSDFTLDLSGGSSVDMGGSAGDLDLEASGGSSFDLSGFRVHDANVEMSGGSHGTINLDGRLDADLSSGSSLLYVGDPTLGNIQKSGGSSLDKSN